VKAALVVNPIAGKYGESRFAKFANALEKIGMVLLWYKLDDRQPVREIISKLDYRVTPLVILAAGDGTINSAINALVRRDDYEQFNVAVLPIGTANILSMELGVDSPRKFIEAIVGGKIKKLHLGKVTALSETGNNSSYFTLMASAGLDSQAVSGVDEKLKRKIGSFAYLYEFFKILLKKGPCQLEANVDGQIYSGMIVCVNNGKYYGIKLPITDAKIDKNNFNVIIIKKMSIVSIVKYIFTKNSNKHITRLTNKSCITIASKIDNYPLQVDGDYHYNLPTRIESTNTYLNTYYL
jgi:diacylglycerol kinase family enzyme